MINSMTAFSHAEKKEREFAVAVEIRSYNSKNLDIALRLHHGYMVFEDRVKSLIQDVLTRGRIEIKITVVDNSEDACAFDVDEIRAAAYHKALVRLKDKLNIEVDIPIEILARANGVIVPVDIQRDIEESWPVIKDCLNTALEDLKLMRQKEGDFICKDILERLEYIKRNIKQIKAESTDLLIHYKEQLKERIAALTNGIIDIDQGRIAQEAAFLADRSDISEEIVRVLSHIQQFRTIIASDVPGGRKLNFLLQEFNREFNTIGSKTGKVDVAHRVVDVKAELEKIREQVQNIE